MKMEKENVIKMRSYIIEIPYSSVPQPESLSQDSRTAAQTSIVRRVRSTDVSFNVVLEPYQEYTKLSIPDAVYSLSKSDISRYMIKILGREVRVIE